MTVSCQWKSGTVAPTNPKDLPHHDPEFERSFRISQLTSSLASGKPLKYCTRTTPIERRCHNPIHDVLSINNLTYV